ITEGGVEDAGHQSGASPGAGGEVLLVTGDVRGIGGAELLAGTFQLLNRRVPVVEAEPLPRVRAVCDDRFGGLPEFPIASRSSVVLPTEGNVAVPMVSALLRPSSDELRRT
ncbi:MAG: hypothetical protein L0H20_11640, partial [Corynebacterium sp.]|uniref:hypothetical protein n=1 Tax=Corynebacterium sp. TaxID=1720 RepID=UPI002648DA2D